MAPSRKKRPGGGTKPATSKQHHSSKPATKHHSNGKPASKPAPKPNPPPTPATALADPHDPRATIPFDLTADTILLVGEGDLSFTRALAETHCPPSIVATTYDTLAALHDKYPTSAAANLNAIRAADPDAVLLHGIDATRLAATKQLRGTVFDRVVFNFPHVGGKSTDVNRQVRYNQELLVGFFKAAQGLRLADGATVVVTLFEGEPYTLWNVRDLARHAGLEVVRSFRFEAGLYPGYSHARTLGTVEGGGGWKGEEREARSYVFRKKVEEKRATGDGGKRKRQRTDGGESSDDDD